MHFSEFMLNVEKGLEKLAENSLHTLGRMKESSLFLPIDIDGNVVTEKSEHAVTTLKFTYTPVERLA
jgi:hypothetical protein